MVRCALSILMFKKSVPYKNLNYRHTLTTLHPCPLDFPQTFMVLFPSLFFVCSMKKKIIIIECRYMTACSYINQPI